MLSDYIAIIIFILISVFMPVSLILTSKMLRSRTTSNVIEDSAYESAEVSKGNRISIMNEYIHYFPMFLLYEIIVAVLIVWAPVSKKLQFNLNIFIIFLLVVGFIFEVLLLLLARRDK